LHGEQDIRRMGGLGKYIKVTFITFLIGSLAISGIPPFAGFFSKDEILAKAFEHNPAIWAILSISAMLTAFYMFRLVYLTFSGNFRGSEETKKHIHESPALMTIPLVILTVLSIVGGFIGLPTVLHLPHLLNNYLSAVTGGSVAILGEAHHLSHNTEYALIATAIGAAIVSILFARYKYVTQQTLPAEDADINGVGKIVYNKFYVDEFYNSVFVKPLRYISDVVLMFIDKFIIDFAVNALAWIVDLIGKVLRVVQTGNTGFYVFAMVVGMLILFLIRFVTE